MTTYVCITTINHPTESVRAWAKLYPGKVLVVGDEKTPRPWSCEGAIYRMPLAPLHNLGSLEDLIGANRYQRKMLRYLAAERTGAEVIVDTDDDNMPLLPFFPLPFSGENFVFGHGGWINTYRVIGQHGWPRGLPLAEIGREIVIDGRRTNAEIGCWQGLATGDADVDAIYRLTDGRPIEFFGNHPFTLTPGTLSTINSQATLWRRECFPLMYLPCTVSMRVCDILRGYVAQPIMWAAGYRLGICGPIVRQERNPHDLMDDFRQELPLYLGMGEAVVEKVSAVVHPEASMADNLRAAYAAIRGVHGIGDEGPILEEWLTAIGMGAK